MKERRFISPSYRFKVEVTIDLSYRPCFTTLCSMAIEDLNRAIFSQQFKDKVSIKEISPLLV